MVNLRQVDLNLLVIVDALFDEAHVGRAARRIGLSQPAMSNALSRARILFDDPLLIRATASGLRRTPRADALRAPLREALSGLSAVVDARASAAADLRGAVRLVCPDVPGATLSAVLAAELAQRAPNIDSLFHPWHVGNETQRLERGEIDLAVTVQSFFAAPFRTEPLASYSCAVMVRRDHPSGSTVSVDLDAWLASPHVVVSGRGDPSGSIDAVLTRLGRHRRVGAVVPTFLHAAELLARTDMIGTFPDDVMYTGAASGLTAYPPPVALDAVDLHLVRHRRTDPVREVRLIADMIAAMATRHAPRPKAQIPADR